MCIYYDKNSWPHFEQLLLLLTKSLKGKIKIRNNRRLDHNASLKTNYFCLGYAHNNKKYCIVYLSNGPMSIVSSLNRKKFAFLSYFLVYTLKYNFFRFRIDIDMGPLNK